jgi:hypothetical protein
MPRSNRQRRQENRYRRRQARRSLNLLLLDDDLVAPEEEDLAELTSKHGHGREIVKRELWLAPDDSGDQ